MTINWNNSGNYSYGVWRCDITIVTNTNADMVSGLIWNTISTTEFNVNTTSTSASGFYVFGSGPCQVLKLSFTLNVINVTTTYYLNFKKTGGGALSANLGASQIQFTRIA